jgi:hypothetical protein
MRFIVDPPSGWLYGFPALLDLEKETYTDLLVRKGYPAIPLALKCSLWRKVTGEVEEEEAGG